MDQQVANHSGENVIPLQDTIQEGAREAACLIAYAQLLTGQHLPWGALVPVFSENATSREGGIN